ncbi:MAG TPA: hypothetical protein VEY33_02765 [Gemmatimonadota bacterium]|nr:hypothetical protein [Gemmatimonadota bacterium]
MNSEQTQTVLEEIKNRLGPGEHGRPYPPVDLLHGYYELVEGGRWRLYILDSADYVEGSDADMGAKRSFLTPNGDMLMWVRTGADLKLYQNGSQTMAATRQPVTSWHP